MSNERPMTSGQAAKAGGVNLETLRYYERRGILPKPRRSASGYRLYPEEALLRLRFVKRAKELGFSLREVKELLSLQARPGARCEDVCGRAQAKIGDIEQKIHVLERMRESLVRLVAQCRGRRPLTECPILECLEAT